MRRLQALAWLTAAVPTATAPSPQPHPWPPSRCEWRSRARSALAVARVLRASRRIRSRFALSVLSAAAVVLRRVGHEPFHMAAWTDARALLRRKAAGERLRQAVPASRSDARRLFAAEPQGRGLLVAVLHCSLARLSDWSRPAPMAGRGVVARDLSLLTAPRSHRHHAVWQVRYRATKTDPTGSSRTVAFAVPAAVHLSLLRRRQDAKRRRQPLFEVSATQLNAWLRRRHEQSTTRRRLTAHSFRRGGIRTAVRAGVPGAAIAQMTGHSSLELLTRYAGLLPPEWVKRQLQVSRGLLGRRPRRWHT